MYCVFLGRATATNAPAAGSVNTAAIAADAITEAKIADDAVESEHLNDNVISGQTELASAPASTDELLISDAGTLKRIDVSLVGGTNTPTFLVRRNSSQTINDVTTTKVTWDAEVFDTDSAFASDKFTVPSGKAGKYFFGFHAHVYDSGEHLTQVNMTFYKNGSVIGSVDNTVDNGQIVTSNTPATLILDLSVGDYIETYVRGNTTDNNTFVVYGESSFYTYFYGYKLI
jgi:hypothetical protein